MSNKRELLLHSALDIFYRCGINAIGINEVLKVAGVAKRTLYSHFDSKDALVLATLALRHRVFMDWLEQKLENSRTNAELIDTLFSALESWFAGGEGTLGDFRGCFFINTAAEFSDTQSDVYRYCHYHKEQVRQLIKRKLNEDHNDLLDAICLLKEGVITTAYVTGEGKKAVMSSKKILHQLCMN